MTAEPPFATPDQALRHHAAQRPAATALAFPETGRRLSFAEWLADAEALARGLLDLGLSPGDHVALLAENRLEWPVSQMRCGSTLSVWQASSSTSSASSRPQSSQSKPYGRRFLEALPDCRRVVDGVAIN